MIEKSGSGCPRFQAVTREFEFPDEGLYTTSLMSTGLQSQYTVLVTAVIGSAVVPTLIAQNWFQPEFRALGPEVEEAEAVAGEEP